MTSMHGIIFARKFIGTKELAEQFFAILKEANMEPDKIGLYEPIKENYSMEKASDMWTLCENSRNSGGMMGKKKKPNLLFDIGWARGPKARPNDITFFLNPEIFIQNKGVMEFVFRETFILFDGLYGYITHNWPQRRQHVTGGIDTRMPGVFLCNYFGPLYVDFFGREKILSGPWVKTEELDSGTIVTYLADEPDKEILESDFLEKRAKEHLGVESFGDPEEAKKNIDELQLRKVPAIVIPEVRG